MRVNRRLNGADGERSGKMGHTLQRSTMYLHGSYPDNPSRPANASGACRPEACMQACRLVGKPGGQDNLPGQPGSPAQGGLSVVCRLLSALLHVNGPSGLLPIQSS